MQAPIRLAVLGAGNRGTVYANHILKDQNLAQVKAVIDPHTYRREKMIKEHQLEEKNGFSSLKEFIDANMEVDGVINTTMDQDHYETSLAVLNAGYHMLLEKPICLNKKELFEIYELAKQKKRTVMICHVLRYAPFYVKIKELLNDQVIGEVFSIQTEENVSYHHLAAAFIRGKWNNVQKCGSPMLMSKCCHDLDILTFLKSGVVPTQVSSMGNLFQFKEENAPAGAGKYCLIDCEIEEDCIYSAKKMYLEDNTYKYYSTQFLHGHSDMDTYERREWGLKNGNPHGRCVWHCDNNIVDHQTATILFEDQCIATHHLTGATAKPSRTIHITGTKGEIMGVMEEGLIDVLTFGYENKEKYNKETIDVNVGGDAHGGGDDRLMDDFIGVLSGKKASGSSTTLTDSIYGHLIGFNADIAMNENRIVQIERVEK